MPVKKDSKFKNLIAPSNAKQSRDQAERGQCLRSMEEPIIAPEAETPVSAPAPSPEATPPVAETVPPEPTLYELPDGRKVPGEELTKEWKENFLPDYTKKSQQLAALEKFNQPSEQPWQNPDWVPQTGQELLDAAEARIRSSFQKEAEAEKQLKEQVNTYVEGQLAEIKKIDANFDPNLVFQEANKIKTTDLMAAYKNIKERESVVRATEERVLKDLKVRGNDPIASKPGTGIASEGIEYNPNESVKEYYARITK